jgi:hypothetical protein
MLLMSVFVPTFAQISDPSQLPEGFNGSGRWDKTQRRMAAHCDPIKVEKVGTRCTSGRLIEFSIAGWGRIRSGD